MTYRHRLLFFGLALLFSVASHLALMYIWSRADGLPQKPQTVTQIQFEVSSESLQPLNPQRETVSLPAGDNVFSEKGKTPLAPKPTREKEHHKQSAQIEAKQPDQPVRQTAPEAIDREKNTKSVSQNTATLPSQTGMRTEKENAASKPSTQAAVSGATKPDRGSLAAGAIAMIRGGGGQSGGVLGEKPEGRRKQTINQATKDVRFRQYAEDWRQKVQRVGAVAYPESLDKSENSGKVLVRVIIASDGSIAQLGVLKSSKNKALDEAALRIVRLAAPFSPFPASFKDEVDLIEITRWWSFEEVFR